MKKQLMTMMILVVWLGGVSFGQNNSAKTEDEAAIRANAEQMVKGWNQKSGVEFAKPFAEDSDYVVINGVHIKGRAANAEAHQRIFDTIYKNSSVSHIIEQIRFLRPDVAVVHVQTALKVTQDNSAQAHHGRITVVMTKNKGKWEIAAFQNTPIQ
jgi:uncharacterized protein (TIGR02246 family)